jgi:hypothetical protein
MIVPPYRIAPSAIPQAGQGLYLEVPAARGAVLIAPDKVHTLLPESVLRRHAEDSIEVRSSVRWFEDWYSITPEWSDECYVNHSFAPTGLWHLGFIFALRGLAAGTELTIDYRLVIGSGETMPFKDSVSGQPIIGLPWAECLRQSTRQLAELIPPA